jgi:2-methylcitrate dehydratase
MDAIAGRFEIDWSREDLERVLRTGIKKYNAEFHSQPALEGVLELKRAHGFTAADVERIEIDVFDVAYHIIGGGEEGEKTIVRTKEDADHSLHYMVAVAILDGQVMPEQYELERVLRDDVQTMLRKVTVRRSEEYSRRFPDEMPTRLAVVLRDRRTLVTEKWDFEGFPTRPMRWETVVEKFDRLSAPYTSTELRRQIVDAVAHLDTIQVRDLANLLAKVRAPRKRARGRR